MAPMLLLAFIGVPIIEIAVLIEVGQVIGTWPTLGLIVLSAVIGSLELRRQGFATVMRLRQEVEAGQVPAQTLFDGVCLVAAGALLLTPGFVTDAVGLSLFLPPVRQVLRLTLGRYLANRMTTHVHTSAHGPGSGPIDADYTDVTGRGPGSDHDPADSIDRR